MKIILNQHYSSFALPVKLKTHPSYEDLDMDHNDRIEHRKPVRYIFRAWRTGRDGERLWAKDYGLKAWRIPVYAD